MRRLKINLLSRQSSEAQATSIIPSINQWFERGFSTVLSSPGCYKGSQVYVLNSLRDVSGTDDTEERMEVMELENHPYYVATQFHPEYLSRPLKPSPPFLGLILASVGRLQTFFSRGCKLSPRESDDSDYIDSGQPTHSSLLCINTAFVLNIFTKTI